MRQIRYSDTMQEPGTPDPAGLPLTSLFVLRNLARNIPKALARPEEEAGAISQPARRAMQTLFLPIKNRLHQVMAHNRGLAVHVADLLTLIEKGVAEAAANEH